ncbi:MULTISPECIES: lysozyme inhibitor LprI family protein [Nitrincola]|uniref:Lysozyme inhibitor LprI-like N-terminal domain-containing protein n=1 Tax=Nitrincola nitratireducens TaxID=1229521 RepID=W9V1V0_9GAMM|nr:MULTISPECIES: lysozyme inhibitor LprI family protein [Nitrincola]EXJ10916.1 hypothetical protein D791_02014 [Nitrincola nitratireducens]
MSILFLKFKEKVLFLLLLMFFLSDVFSFSIAEVKSHTGNGYLHCKSIITSAQVDKCTQNNLKESNELLAEVIEVWKNETLLSYQPDHELGMELIELFDIEQSLWEAFRDASCVREAFEIEHSSIAYLTTVSHCKEIFNKARVEYINSVMLFSRS